MQCVGGVNRRSSASLRVQTQKRADRGVDSGKLFRLLLGRSGGSSGLPTWAIILPFAEIVRSLACQ